MRGIDRKMNYNRIIKSRKLRLKILSLLNWIPDKLMIRIQYRIKTGRKLNLKNPKRFTEKLQGYKLYYRDPLMTKCSDKYLVRNYVKEKGLSHILNELYGVYDKIDEIDFDNLPEKFVIKTTNGSGTNIICKDKNKLNKEEVIKSLSEWIKRDLYIYGREWSYKNIKPKIIIEELLEEKNNEFTGINDYKFLCFNGQPKYIILDVDRYNGHKRNIYDLEWNELSVLTDKPNINKRNQKPKNLNEMIQIAQTLSKDFPFVRVDLYNINGKIYFGELTFYPWTGYVKFKPDEFDYILGKEFKLPEEMEYFNE